MGVRITTWNVNGIRNPFGYHPWREKRTFDSMFDTLEADIVVFQELKIQRKDLRDDMVMIPGWDVYFSLPKHKKGYSGVAIYTRQSTCAPIRAEEGLLGVLSPPTISVAYRDMSADEHIGGYLTVAQLARVNVDPIFLDSEGRCVILEFPAFVLFGIYSPANSSGTRDDFRHGFLLALDMRVRNLIRQGKRIVVCGDLNVSREEIDTANAVENMRKEHISHKDYLSTPNRRIFNQMLDGGKVFGARDEGRDEAVMWDVCRAFHPDRHGMFTHWEQKINARPGNFGSRIDFILSSMDMKGWFCGSDIQEGLMGSDHCPVYAELHNTIDEQGNCRHVRDILNPLGTFHDGHRRREISSKDMPAFSAKLMPEFDKRRNIKDMFGRGSTNPRPALPHLEPEAQTEACLNDTRTEKTSANVVGSPADTGSAEEALIKISPTSNLATPRGVKRRLSNAICSPQNSKKQGRGFDKERFKSTTGSQQSLKGFFTAKQAPMRKTAGIEPQKEPASPRSVASANRRTSYQQPVPNDSSTADVHETFHEQEPIIDPAASKLSWSKLLAKPSTPLCEHEEPCKVMKTKKPGFNCGREFWMCQRPLGPSGEKERKSQWRCPTFIWSSDWKPK